MKKIDELIQQYKQMSASYYDDVVIIELDKINQLYSKYQETSEEIFVCKLIEAFLKITDTQKEQILDFGSIDFSQTDISKIIELFCKIIKTQRELICCLTEESECDCDCYEDALYQESDLFSADETSVGDSFIPSEQTSAAEITPEDFRDDKQLQAAFTAYCLKNGKSSYTANDYCSRIKNLWKNFYSEYKEGKLEDYLKLTEEKVNPDSPLLNVYYHADMLCKYIMIKIDETDGNRNWTNARAAFNKFDKFRMSIENNQG